MSGLWGDWPGAFAGGVFAGYAVLWVIVGALGGALVGRYRRRIAMGLLLGALLGPLGWLAVLYTRQPNLKADYRARYDVWVDPFIRIVKYHEDISEHMAVMAHIPYAVDADRTCGRIKKINAFLDRNVFSHFEFEENVVFPVMARRLNTGRPRQLIEKLIRDHREILGKVRTFRMVVNQYTAGMDAQTIRRINLMYREITDRLLAHAGEEDEKLFPLIALHQDLFGIKPRQRTQAEESRGGSMPS